MKTLKDIYGEEIVGLYVEKEEHINIYGFNQFNLVKVTGDEEVSSSDSIWIHGSLFNTKEFFKRFKRVGLVFELLCMEHKGSQLLYGDGGRIFYYQEIFGDFTIEEVDNSITKLSELERDTYGHILAQKPLKVYVQENNPGQNKFWFDTNNFESSMKKLREELETGAYRSMYLRQVDCDLYYKITGPDGLREFLGELKLCAYGSF